MAVSSEARRVLPPIRPTERTFTGSIREVRFNFSVVHNIISDQFAMDSKDS